VKLTCTPPRTLVKSIFLRLIWHELAGVYWEWSKKKRKFVILCGVTGTILYYPRPLQ
jgi:hypothetical protein